MKLFTETHEWIRIEGKKAVVGITQHAQKEIGSIVFVNLPEKGAIFKKGDEAFVVESTKAASDIPAPIAGVVSDVNESLMTDPTLLNSAPEDEGWVYVLDIENDETTLDLKYYMNENEYRALLLRE